MPRILVIVGPTASGKSELAMKLAAKFDGEIIAADSRTIYTGMDIGTAKPTAAEQAKIPHFGLDLVEPGQSFSAHDYKAYANRCISDIQKRGRLPILVGGTGLYIDGIIFDFNFRPAAKKSLRLKLEAMTVEKLQAIVEASGYQMPQNSTNKRHLVRAIETEGQVGERRRRPLIGTLIVGLNPPDRVLKKQITARISKNFEDLVSETGKLLKQFGETQLRRTAGIPYLVALDYLAAELTKAEALQKIQTAEWQYARRQRTWFKRNRYIKWYGSAKEAFEAVKSSVD